MLGTIPQEKKLDSDCARLAKISGTIVKMSDAPPLPPKLDSTTREALIKIKNYLKNNRTTKTVANLQILINAWGTKNNLNGMTSINKANIGNAREKLDVLKRAAEKLQREEEPESVKEFSYNDWNKAVQNLENAINKIKTAKTSLNINQRNAINDVIKKYAMNTNPIPQPAAPNQPE